MSLRVTRPPPPGGLLMRQLALFAGFALLLMAATVLWFVGTTREVLGAWWDVGDASWERAVFTGLPFPLAVLAFVMFAKFWGLEDDE